MKYTSAGAFRAALETRLRSEQSEGIGVSRLRKRVVIERLLARLHTATSKALECSWQAIAKAEA